MSSSGLVLKGFVCFSVLDITAFLAAEQLILFFLFEHLYQCHGHHQALHFSYTVMIVIQSGLMRGNSIHHSDAVHIHLDASQMGVLAGKEDANAISERCLWMLRARRQREALPSRKILIVVLGSFGSVALTHNIICTLTMDQFPGKLSPVTLWAR